MFSISGLGKQLKSAAEGFEQAGHALQARAAQQQQQQQQAQPAVPAKKPETPAESAKTIAHNNALASRLSSLMAAKGKGASMQRTASNGSTESSRKEYAKPRLTKEELAKMDPADIPLPPSPTIQPQETPLSPTPSSSSVNMFSPAPKQASSSPFNTPRNLASKLVRPTSTSSPVPAVSKLSLGNGPRTDSERDLFSLGQSRVDTPVLGDGKGVETPGAAMAEVEAMLAGVADSAANEENAAAALGDNVLPNSEETKPAVKAEEVNPESVPLPAEDASELPREELEQKYQSLLERTSKADQILKESSPILTEGINDADALEGWVRMITGKAEMATMEIKRLNDKLALQASRMEEVKETHQMEQSSSSALIASLRDQLAQSENSLSSHASTSLQLAQAKADLTTSQAQHKAADEKLTKAVNLLKTVRSKLVTVTKDRDEIYRELEEERRERTQMVENLERLRADREREVQGLRKAYEKETQGLKEKYERETLADRRKWELEMITTKATHAKEIAIKSKHVNSLTESIKELNEEKRSQFVSLQSRQEELDNATAARESSEARLKDLSLQIREAQERAILAEEALADATRSNLASLALQSGSNRDSQDDSLPVALEAANAKAEAKMNELRNDIVKLERERVEMEEEHARQLRNQRTEIERARGQVADKDREVALIASSRKEVEDRLVSIEREREMLNHDLEEAQSTLRAAREAQTRASDGETSVKQETDVLREQIMRLTGEVEDARQSTLQAKATNRNLREEMRRLQSSVQLLERQRNPGVGYWSASGSNANNRSDTPLDGRPSQDGPSKGGKESVLPSTPVARDVKSPAPSETAPRNEEEEVNLEYLRNVILQFLENKEMRPNLVRVLSVILRFTPQELRRLNAKLSS